MDPKESTKAIQKPNSYISKNHKNPRDLMVFASRDLPKEPHEAHDNSQKDPEWLLEMKKKKHQNWNKKTPWFEANLATLAAKIDIQEDTKNGTTSDTPFPHISGVQIMPRQKINERGEKTASPGIILSKKKGGIRTYRAL